MDGTLPPFYFTKLQLRGDLGRAPEPLCVDFCNQNLCIILKILHKDFSNEGWNFILSVPFISEDVLGLAG